MPEKTASLFSLFFFYISTNQNDKAASDLFQVGHGRSGALQMHRVNILQRSAR